MQTMATQPAGQEDQFDWQGLHRYLSGMIDGLSGELRVSQFSGGFSNMTYLIAIGDAEMVMKRPPAGPKAKGAHDMGREYRMLAGLQGHFPYCPRAIAYCGDASVAGSEFLVMERVDGTVVRQADIERLGLSDGQIRTQLIGLIEALARLHRIDPNQALPGFGRPEGYRERQLQGWLTRFQNAAIDDVADFTRVTDWLVAHMPATPASAAVVHNDFKLDNLIWTGPELTELRGVLDWEMATVGDPLMDLACTLSFWVEPGDPEEFRALRAMPSAIAAAPTRREAIALYCAHAGASVEHLDFYYCFGLFRRAVIEQQKYARFRRGHSSDQRYAGLDRAVRVIRDMCEGVIAKGIV